MLPSSALFTVDSLPFLKASKSLEYCFNDRAFLVQSQFRWRSSASRATFVNKIATTPFYSFQTFLEDSTEFWRQRQLTKKIFYSFSKNMLFWQCVAGMGKISKQGQKEKIWYDLHTQSSTRSRFSWDKMDFEILVLASLNEWEWDFLKCGLNRLVWYFSYLFWGCFYFLNNNYIQSARFHILNAVKQYIQWLLGTKWIKQYFWCSMMLKRDFLMLNEA